MSEIRIKQGRHGCLVQLLWFLLIGWWAGQVWIALTWLVMLTIIGIPLSVKMLNKIPSIIALRGKPEDLVLEEIDGVTVVSTRGREQRNLILRTLHFLIFGWWLTALWLELAYLLCLTIIGLPIGFWMFDKAPTVLSLRRN